jgi:hypothetical protein
MGALAWARSVIADTGEPEPIRVAIDGDTAADAYELTADVRGGLGGAEQARIPVSRRPNPAPHPILKEIHSCDVAGRPLEAESADALRAKVAAALERIAPARVLPVAYFRAPAVKYELPVYESEDGLMVHGFAGPRTRGRDLAELRANVARHLTTAGYLAGADDLEVALVRGSDLRLVRPLAVIRSVDDPDVWIPWVERADVTGDAHDALGVGRNGGDVLQVLATLRSERPGAYASHVRTRAWRDAAARTEPAGLRLRARDLVLDVRHADSGLAVAVDCGGIDVFLELTPDRLAAVVGRHLVACRFLDRPDAVSVI